MKNISKLLLLMSALCLTACGEGSQGPKGPRGRQGLTGEVGEKGLQGETGDQGDPGIQGRQGTQGIQGEKGERGDQGDQGPKGPEGIKGPQGNQGSVGEQGDKGDKGATGEKGDKGEQGETGAQGPKGDTGAQGAKGDKGDTGAPNNNLFTNQFLPCEHGRVSCNKSNYAVGETVVFKFIPDAYYAAKAIILNGNTIDLDKGSISYSTKMISGGFIVKAIFDYNLQETTVFTNSSHYYGTTGNHNFSSDNDDEIFAHVVNATHQMDIHS